MLVAFAFPSGVSLPGAAGLGFLGFQEMWHLIVDELEFPTSGEN
jgi:hypothetical protein